MSIALQLAISGPFLFFLPESFALVHPQQVPKNGHGAMMQE